jgi:uncharacterized protein YbcI
MRGKRKPCSTTGTPRQTTTKEAIVNPIEDSLELEQMIADEIMRIHQTSYGRGAKRARAYVLEDDVIVFLDDLELLPNEEFLIDNGHSDPVLNVRSKFQQAIETTFRAAVERATGRKVIAFTSNTSLDPHFVVETFRLEPH